MSKLKRSATLTLRLKHATSLRIHVDSIAAQHPAATSPSEAGWYKRSYLVFTQCSPWRSASDLAEASISESPVTHGAPARGVEPSAPRGATGPSHATVLEEKHLVHALAFAGSWIPGIPKTQANASTLQQRWLLTKALQAIAKRDVSCNVPSDEEMKCVIDTAVDAFRMRAKSTSVILLSKALHFLAPDLVPIMDRLVIIEVNRLIGTWARPLGPLTPTKSGFLAYWSLMASARWCTTPTYSYRHIEEILFKASKHS